MPRGGTVAAVLLGAGLVVACGGPSGSGPATTDSTPTTSALASGGVPIGTVGDFDLGRVRAALLGEPPYPSGWEAEVDELIASLEQALEGIRVPDVAGLGEREAACAVWRPVVGRTPWATGAILERQFFIAHAMSLASVAPADIRGAATEAAEVAAAAAAEQLRPDGDPAVVSHAPDDAIRTIGLWAVEHCDLPIEADEPPNTEGWTADEIAQSCTWDREWLTDAQHEYFESPGDGTYAEHPHLLEVTLEIFVYPAWHRLAHVDNASDPPTFAVEPIPGSFCDR